MIAPVFVDTNVLIYALDEADLKKQQAARVWRAELWKSRRGRISFQVLQEFYAKVTQKWPSARPFVRDVLIGLAAGWTPAADAEIMWFAARKKTSERPVLRSC